MKQLALSQGFTEAQFQASQTLGASRIIQPANEQAVVMHSIKEPLFRRDLTKNEAGIMPDPGSTISIAKRKDKTNEVSAYEHQVNGRVVYAN